MFNDLPARIHLIAGSDDKSETNLSVGPSFTATMASIMSKHIKRRNRVDITELYVELSKWTAHLHTIPFRSSAGLSERPLLLRKVRASRMREDELVGRGTDADITPKVDPPSPILGPLFGGGDLSYTLVPPLDDTKTKNQLSAFDSNPQSANIQEDAPHVAAKPARRIHSDDGGHLVDEQSHPRISSPIDETGVEFRFSQRLIKDLGYNTSPKSLSGFPRSELVSILRGFAGRLHEAGTTSSDRILSVALHRKSE